MTHEGSFGIEEKSEWRPATDTENEVTAKAHRKVLDDAMDEAGIVIVSVDEVTFCEEVPDP